MEVLTMKLQYVQSRIGDKIYGKYQVAVPRDIVERAGWKANEEVMFRADGKGRIIATIHPPQEKPLSDIRWQACSEAYAVRMHFKSVGEVVIRRARSRS